MTERERIDIIKDIATEVANLRKPVAESYINNYKELKMLKMDYLPSPFEMADYYKIKYEFIETKDGRTSYLSEGLGTIYISDEYTKDSYKSKILCAHELGHFFRHPSTKEHYFPKKKTMRENKTGHFFKHPSTKEHKNKKKKIMQEYEANVFAILLMPQIMAGQPWETYSPKQLNRLVYKKVLKN